MRKHILPYNILRFLFVEHREIENAKHERELKAIYNQLFLKYYWGYNAYLCQIPMVPLE